MTKNRKPTNGEADLPADQPESQATPPEKPPKKTRNVGLPIPEHDILERLKEEEDRSVNWYVRQAVRAYLVKRGLWPPKSEAPP